MNAQIMKRMWQILTDFIASWATIAPVNEAIGAIFPFACCTKAVIMSMQISFVNSDGSSAANKSKSWLFCVFGVRLYCKSAKWKNFNF